MRSLSSIPKLKIVLGVTLLIFGIATIIVLVVALTSNPCETAHLSSRIERITSTYTDEGLVVTWTQPPVFTTCAPRYEVLYNSPVGEFSEITNSESIVIPLTRFCLKVDVSIRALTGAATHYYTASFTRGHPIVVNFSTSRAEPNVLTVTWNHASQEWCSLTYDVHYVSTTNGQFVTVSEPEARFLFEYCDPVAILIVPIAANGFHLPTTGADATQYPREEDIDTVRFLNVTAYDELLVLAWRDIEPIGMCNVTYNIEIQTDRVFFTRPLQLPTFQVSRNDFCFSVEHRIQAVMGRSFGSLSTGSILYGLGPVQDLELTRSMENYTLDVTWTEHWLQDRCGVRYIVIYEHGSINITTMVNQPNVTFDVAYCVPTTVRVKTTHNNRLSDERNVTIDTEYPTSLPPVENVFIDRNNTSAIVSWDSPPSVSECTDLYKVTAINKESGEENFCLGITSCEIILDNFCPYTNFTISPTSIPGDAATEMHICF